MMRRQERETVRADLAAVQNLIELRKEDDDPVGWAQLSFRKHDLEDQLAGLSEESPSKQSVGLIFGGRPVMGSRGIAAEFGAVAIGNFQALVSTRFASMDGAVGERGPLPHRDRTQMLITDVARGSFGFVLEELGVQDQPAPATVGGAMDEVCDLIHRVASVNEEDFRGAAESVDNRLLTSLKNFFKHMDDAGATLRVVAEEKQFELSREAIGIARERTETLEVSETFEDISGRLFILPDARRFEIYPFSGGSPIRGSITPDCMRQIAADGTPVAEGIAGAFQTVHLRVREVRSQKEASRKSYQLLSISRQIAGS